MNWIKDNKFLVALGGGTLVGVILIFLAGYEGASKYQQAKDDFDVKAAEAATFEGLPLYPRPENRDGKRKALDDYRQATEVLQAAFAPFCPPPLKNVSPQKFTDQLKAVNEEVGKACAASQTKLPEPFFCGFENYKTTLANSNATGLLEYQLAGIKQLMLALARAGASELKNVHRPVLPEESGREYKPQAAEVARSLPLEITFAGPEKAVREFFSTLIKQDNQYVVIRSLAITNSKKEPPRAADAKFDKAPPKPAISEGGFPSGTLLLPGDVPKTDPVKPAAPAAPDSSRILAQVLGNEEVLVFLRLDFMQFLPAKQLP